MKLDSFLQQLKSIGVTVEKDTVENGFRTVLLSAKAPCPPHSVPRVWHSLSLRPGQKCIDEIEALVVMKHLWVASEELVN